MNVIQGHEQSSIEDTLRSGRAFAEQERHVSLKHSELCVRNCASDMYRGSSSGDRAGVH